MQALIMSACFHGVTVKHQHEFIPRCLPIMLSASGDMASVRNFVRFILIRDQPAPMQTIAHVGCHENVPGIASPEALLCAEVIQCWFEMIIVRQHGIASCLICPCHKTTPLEMLARPKVDSFPIELVHLFHQSCVS